MENNEKLVLVKNIEEFEHELINLLEQAYVLYNTNIVNFEQLNQMKDDFDDLDYYVAEWLKRSFNIRINEFYLEYITRPKSYFSKRVSLEEGIFNFKWRMNKQIIKLERFKVSILPVSKSNSIDKVDKTKVFINKIQDLISKGNIETAVNEVMLHLRALEKTPALNDVITLSSELYRMRTQKDLGLIEFETVRREENRITKAVLGIINNEINSK